MTNHKVKIAAVPPLHIVSPEVDKTRVGQGSDKCEKGGASSSLCKPLSLMLRISVSEKSLNKKIAELLDLK